MPDGDAAVRTTDGNDGGVKAVEGASAAGADTAIAAATPARQTPPQSPAMAVQDTAPAAGAPAAAATADPSPIPPAKPAIDDDPERLIGLGTAALTRMLGNPGFVRRDSSAQLWRYRNKTCILDLFLYPNSGRTGYIVSHVETRRREGGAAAKRECFGALLLERRDREAG